MTRKLVTIVILFAVMTACSQQDKTMFSKLGKNQTGIDFVNDNHETERSNIFTYEYFYNGGGVAIGDINNDGLADIYFTSNIFSNKLYLNEGNFKFRDITESSGTACETGWKTGGTMVDINGDGLLDIYVSRSASPDPERRRNILLINNGDLTFTDKAKEFNLDDASYSTHAAFFDFDNDNDLDAILLNHSLLDLSNSFDIRVKNSDVRFPDVGNRLLRNDNGRFTDVSDSVGVYGSAFNYGLGLSLSDINNDGWIDIYTGCDYTGRDKLLINAEGKSFRDVTAEQLSHVSKFTMGTDIADINGDGLMDIFTLDMLPEDNRRQKQLMGTDRYDVHATMVKNGLHSQYMRNMLHLNNGNGTFSEIGQLAGVSNTDWSWAPLFADFDNDGVLDLFVTNGFKRDLTDNDFAKFAAFQEIVDARKAGKDVSFLEVISKFTENRIPNYIYQGNEGLTFSDRTKEWGFDHSCISNGAAYADLDNDGDLDLVVNNINEKAGIYRNNANKFGNHFLRIQLAGDGQNKSAIGARVEVYAGKKHLVREMFPVRGFQSSIDPVLHFGLGTTTSVDSIVVRWPDGETKVVSGTGIDQKIVITRNDGVTRTPVVQNNKPLFSALSDAIPFTHRENEYIDFRVQALLPRMYSTQGPAMALGDVNNDGLQDVYVGGAKGQTAGLFIQTRDGNFQEKTTDVFSAGTRSEDVDAVFFDMDKDGDLDLYVVTGGYEYEIDDTLLQDKLYENDGKGNFKIKNLPEFSSSGSRVRPSDVDGDGDIDLFVTGRIVPGRYPEIPSSYMLINDGKGNFSIDPNLSNRLKFAGMITDALWVDLNKDNIDDLIVVGEWMPIRVFINKKGSLTEHTEQYVEAGTEGLWNCIIAADFDGDGDQDFVAGNFGRNSQMKVDRDKPATLVYHDYDANGSIDLFLNYYVKGESYPYPTRDELTEQVPSFKKRFTNYSSYSNAVIENVLTESEIAASKQLSAYELNSCYIRNDGNKFTMVPMPAAFQFAPVFAMETMDVNNDGHLDIISGGNLSATRSRTGKLSGNGGFVFHGDGKGNFTFVHPARTGIKVPDDVRQIKKDGVTLFFAINNRPVQVYRLN